MDGWMDGWITRRHETTREATHGDAHAYGNDKGMEFINNQLLSVSLSLSVVYSAPFHAAPLSFLTPSAPPSRWPTSAVDFRGADWKMQISPEPREQTNERCETHKLSHTLHLIQSNPVHPSIHPCIDLTININPLIWTLRINTMIQTQAHGAS